MSLSKTRLACASLALLALPSSAAILLGAFQNGSFDELLQGWQTSSLMAADGPGQADAQTSIDSLGFLGGDDSVAGLHVFASAGSIEGAPEPGKAIAQARLEQRLRGVRSTMLSFDWTSAFTGTALQTGEARFEASVRIRKLGPVAARPEAQRSNVFELFSGELDGGIIVDGRPLAMRRVEIDMSQAGIRPGDDVLVQVVLEARADSGAGSGYVTFSGILWVDEFFVNPPKIRRADRQLLQQ
jgi:hypothetical protein